jgi:hypothetical protein
VKAIVYIDGFNLYYGIRNHGRCKWLNLARLCEVLLPADTIRHIHYFTARVSPRPNDPDIHLRQQAFLRALSTIPNLTIHYGHYLSRPTRMWLANPPTDGPKTVEVIKTEEKGSDVNLACQLLLDAVDGNFELAAIISNDSDLIFPIRTVRQRFGLKVGVFNPHANPSHALREAASFYRPIRAGAVQACQFPPTLADARGVITKPLGW